MITDRFIEFARLQGVTIDPAKVVADGRIRRADVGESASGKNDASYLLRENGSGWVLNFKGDGRLVHYRPERTRDTTPEELAKIEAERQAWRAEQAERRQRAIVESVALWNRARDGNDFPYLKTPDMPAYGLRQTGGRLLVPVLAVADDNEAAWVGMQRIDTAEAGQSAAKRFVAGTPTKGAFTVIPIHDADEEAPLRAFDEAKTASRVVLCEGIGTALAIHHATGLPVIAALSAQNLPEVAKELHGRLRGEVLIYADNDGEKAQHKGQTCAWQAAEILGKNTRIALPVKPFGETPSGYDARDQLRDGGIQAITETIAGSSLDARKADVERFDRMFARDEAINQQERDQFVIHTAASTEKESGMEQTTETPETRLMREWRQIADPVRAQRNQAQAGLAATHYEQQKIFFDSLEQLRTEHASDLAKTLPELAPEQKDSLIALDIAIRTEQMQKQHAAERKTLLSGLPEVPGYVSFLEQRAGEDADAARLLEVERGRSTQGMAIKGQRIAQMEPMVLEGLTHETESGEHAQAIHYLRDGERVMTDRGQQLDVYRLDDREIEAALRLAEQKYDLDKGLVLTGSREFQERAAEIAGRLNLKIQNGDLQASWQKGHEVAGDVVNLPPAGGIGQADAVSTAEHEIDHAYLGAEYVLARMDITARDALLDAGEGKPLTVEQRELLTGGEKHPPLIDEDGRLNKDGINTYERLRAVMEEDRQLQQQQLRTRNIDEALEAKAEEKVHTEQETREQAREADQPEIPVEIRQPQRRQQSRGMGM